MEKVSLTVSQFLTLSVCSFVRSCSFSDDLFVVVCLFVFISVCLLILFLFVCSLFCLSVHLFVCFAHFSLDELVTSFVCRSFVCLFLFVVCSFVRFFLRSCLFVSLFFLFVCLFAFSFFLQSSLFVCLIVCSFFSEELIPRTEKNPKIVFDAKVQSISFVELWLSKVFWRENLFLIIFLNI